MALRVVLLGGLLAGACSCSSTSARAPGPLDGGADSALPAQDASVVDTAVAPDTALAPDTGGGGCAPNATFTPYPWEPPTPFYQGACTPVQIASYLSCFSFGDCAPFKSVAQNAGCVSCIETDVAATAHGPVITAFGAIQEVNFGGCQATFDGNTSATSCGATFNNLNSCLVNECGDCPDVSENGPQFSACYQAAFAAGGPCTIYDETPTCRAETSAGGVAATCDAISTLLPLWCGAALPDAGADGESG